jgi:diguanylate cyclase (GGDEF)-like protein/PAS domain S-box-containing protein
MASEGSESPSPASQIDCLARRALLTMANLGMAGSAVGLFGMVKGTVAGLEAVLIAASFVCAAGVTVSLLFCRAAPLQRVATVATVYCTGYLCAASIIAVTGSGQHLDLFIYLLWFFPLLVFNKLVNAPAIGRSLGKVLRAAPLLICGGLGAQLSVIFSLPLMLLVAAFCLAYICFGSMLDIVTRYCEELVVERERAESFKVESAVLESISDCFISLDSRLRLVYLNDAACTEFGVERQAALNGTLPETAPAFCSQSMLELLRSAAGNAKASMFEAQNERGGLWYEVRCFPRPDGISMYFRNITASISSRRRLDEAHRNLREQADLLDKAQDAIFVQALDHRIIYWNKGAERLYGWTAETVTGRLVNDVFHDSCEGMQNSLSITLAQGEWSGELEQRRRDGSVLTVESRYTLVRDEHVRPRSILVINTDITDRKAAEAKIEHLAFYDVLTGLPNRMLLRERLDNALAGAVRNKDTGAILFVDLDDFKTLNDTLGHDVGDVFLAQVALRLTSCVRESDTVARFGGDEFVVMLEGLSKDTKTAAAEAKAVGDKLLAALRAPYPLVNREYSSTASVGVTLFPRLANTVDELLKHADLAMYRAKARGRDAMCFFDPEMQTFVDSRAALQSDLRAALSMREFELYYQPQVEANGLVVGAEALVRWPHPQRGMVPPDEFIPLAEEAGLIIELGRWVLETACKQLAQWAARPEMEHLRIAVNVSLRQFLDPNFVNLVLDVIRDSGANPHRLKLEITESAMLEHVDDTIAKITVLKSHRVGFSLDDFGTGYSSLSHLRLLPLDQLKIDRSFVNDVLTNVRAASIARTIITLGQNLDLSVIAEGVETEGQRAFLEREGCRRYQGFLFSAALTATRFEEFVAAAQRPPATVAA